MGNYFTKSYPSYTTSSYTQLVRFKKYDGVSLGGLCNFIIKIYTLDDLKTTILSINNGDSGVKASFIGEPQLDVIVGEKEGYYYILGKATNINNQHIYTQLLHYDNKNFIEPLSYREYNEKTEMYELVTINSSNEKITNIFTTINSKMYCKVGSMILYETNRAILKLNINSSNEKKILHSDVIFQIYRNSSGIMNIKLNSYNNSDDFIIENINIYFSKRTNSTYDIYILNNMDTQMFLNINLDYFNHSNKLNFEFNVENNISTISDTTNSLITIAN